MAEGKYTQIGGVIKQITGEYTQIGGVIKQITINAIGIGGAIKQVSVGDKYIWACEQGSDRLYGIDDNHTDLDGWPKYGGAIADPAAVACDDDGNTYWACANNVYKYNLAGVLQWTYSGHTVPVVSICLENRSGVTYLYTGDTGGTVKCLIDGIVIAGLVWSKTPYVGTAFGLAVDRNNNHLYAAYGIGAVGRVVRLQTINGNYANIFYDGSNNIFSIAIDESASLYIGDNGGNIRKISTGGYVYYTAGKLGEIYTIAADGDYGYYVNGSRGDVGKFTLATGTNVWTDTPAGTSRGVAVDAFGNVYSSHGAYGSLNAVIRKNNSSGVEQWTWQHYVNSEWRGVAVSPGIKAAGF